MSKSVYVAMSGPSRHKIFGPAGLDPLTGTAEVILHPDVDLTADSMVHGAARSEGLIVDLDCPRLTGPLLEQLPRLEFIAHTASSPRRFATDAIFDRGIKLVTASQGAARAVAELALVSTLMLLRRIHRVDRALRRGEDFNTIRGDAMGSEFAAQRIGVIGASQTGREFISISRALGARVDVVDPYLPAAAADAMGVASVSLDEAMAVSDVISIHAPATAETTRMIGARQLSLMRNGSMLVNTARASIVDTEALLSELRSGRISAAVDVFDVEPLDVASEFRSLENVIATAHIGAATVQSFRRRGAIAVEQTQRWMRGEPLRDLVTRERFAIIS